MKNLTLENIARACGGTLLAAQGAQKAEVSEITTDSRQVARGALFAAIPGTRADGHQFIDDVMEKGALAVLCERAPARPRGPYILVGSTLKALMDVAEFYRAQLSVKVVGITGSVGKTSTKELIASVLSEKYRVLKTAGNFNNELGLPLTVFRLREGDEVAVLEMGINHFGEMRRLSKIARPDVCVITNIGDCHLEFLQDRDGVLRAKTEMFEYLSPTGAVVLNGDDDKLRTISEVHGIRPLFFGLSDACAVRADGLVALGEHGTRCRIRDREGTMDVTVPIPGEHMVRNALAAAAVGQVFGMENADIRRGIEKAQTLDGRFRVTKANGITVMDDCYNANPTSMVASLRTLCGFSGRKVAILGDMGELGPEAAAWHRQVGEQMAGMDISCALFVGDLARHMAEAFKENNPAVEVACVPTVEEAIGRLPQMLQKGDNVLVKASHFLHFEKIVAELTCTTNKQVTTRREKQ